MPFMRKNATSLRRFVFIRLFLKLDPSARYKSCVIALAAAMAEGHRPARAEARYDRVPPVVVCNVSGRRYGHNLRPKRWFPACQAAANVPPPTASRRIQVEFS